MELALSDEQNLLYRTVDQMCADALDFNAVRAIEAREDGFSKEFWNALLSVGLPGICIAEQYDGLGLGLVEAALAYEAFGRHLASSPHLVSAILAGGIIQHSGDMHAAGHWLPLIASGQQIVTVAELKSASKTPGLACAGAGVGARLNGRAEFVPFASIADHILIMSTGADGRLGGALVPRTQPGLSLERKRNLAGEPLFHVSCENVEVSEAQQIRGGADLAECLRAARSRAFIALAAQAIGAARRIQEITVDYAKQRVAFGRAIGSFQAIAHHLANCQVELEGCAALVRYAAWMADNGRAFDSFAAMAKLQACAMFRKVSAAGVQVHGGIGYTTEAAPQLFFRRAKQWQVLNGGEAYFEEEIARLSLDQGRDGCV